jgi:hypothetical protein
MTSILAAAAPMLLALVPCLFAHTEPPLAPFVEDDASSPEVEAREPWWKPSTLGIDNYS